MNSLSTVAIDLNEKFIHLPNAPIVEAVFEIRAQPTAKFEESSFRSQFEPKLTGYAFLDSQREYQSEIRLDPGKPPRHETRDLGWKGIRFKSADEKQIAQFNRDSFGFNRLQPYLDWDRFSGEGLRLWNLYQNLARPAEITRISLRFINRIQLPYREKRLKDYIIPAPEPAAKMDLPLISFLHQDTLDVPGYPYIINIIRTIQPPPREKIDVTGVAVILDIDVFTTHNFIISDSEETALARRLSEMRWLKNKLFFGSVTDKALDLFK